MMRKYEEVSSLLLEEAVSGVFGKRMTISRCREVILSFAAFLYPNFSDINVVFSPELRDENFSDFHINMAKVSYEVDVGFPSEVSWECPVLISFFDKRFILEDILLHELAHLLSPGDHCHGEEFLCCFESLKGVYYGKSFGFAS